MNFPGYWVETRGLAIRLTPDVFDEMDLTEASNWTEAHQNEDPSVPHGFTDAARLMAEVAERWLALHPAVRQRLTTEAESELEVRSAEDLALLFLRLAPRLRRERSKPGAPRGPKSGG
jgi:hypothetical protein